LSSFETHSSKAPGFTTLEPTLEPCNVCDILVFMQSLRFFISSCTAYATREQDVCTNCRLLPVHYLSIKEALMRASAAGEPLKRWGLYKLNAVYS
jgi:hypothetical protein